MRGCRRAGKNCCGKFWPQLSSLITRRDAACRKLVQIGFFRSANMRRAAEAKDRRAPSRRVLVGNFEAPDSGLLPMAWLPDSQFTCCRQTPARGRATVLCLVSSALVARTREVGNFCEAWGARGSPLQHSTQPGRALEDKLLNFSRKLCRCHRTAANSDTQRHAASLPEMHALGAEHGRTRVRTGAPFNAVKIIWRLSADGRLTCELPCFRQVCPDGVLQSGRSL